MANPSEEFSAVESLKQLGVGECLQYPSFYTITVGLMHYTDGEFSILTWNPNTDEELRLIYADTLTAGLTELPFSDWRERAANLFGWENKPSLVRRALERANKELPAAQAAQLEIEMGAEFVRSMMLDGVFPRDYVPEPALVLKLTTGSEDKPNFELTAGEDVALALEIPKPSEGVRVMELGAGVADSIHRIDALHGYLLNRQMELFLVNNSAYSASVALEYARLAHSMEDVFGSYFTPSMMGIRGTLDAFDSEPDANSKFSLIVLNNAGNSGEADLKRAIEFANQNLLENGHLVIAGAHITTDVECGADKQAAYASEVFAAKPVKHDQFVGIHGPSMQEFPWSISVFTKSGGDNLR